MRAMRAVVALDGGLATAFAVADAWIRGKRLPSHKEIGASFRLSASQARKILRLAADHGLVVFDRDGKIGDASGLASGLPPPGRPRIRALPRCVAPFETAGGADASRRAFVAERPPGRARALIRRPPGCAQTGAPRRLRGAPFFWETRCRFVALAAAAVLSLALCGAARAADCRAPTTRPPEAAVGVADGRRCRPRSRARSSWRWPDRCLEFHSIAGVAARFPTARARPRAEIAYVAYLLDGQDAAKRPVVFAINGGPGAGSVWLQLGAIGPWRLPMQGLTPSLAADAGGQCGDLARLRRPRLPRSAGNRLQPAAQSQGRREGATSGRSTATSTCSPRRSAAGSAITAGSPRRNSSSARATAAFARRGSPRRWRAISASACAA